MTGERLPMDHPCPVCLRSDLLSIDQGLASGRLTPRGVTAAFPPLTVGEVRAHRDRCLTPALRDAAMAHDGDDVISAHGVYASLLELTEQMRGLTVDKNERTRARIDAAGQARACLETIGRLGGAIMDRIEVTHSTTEGDSAEGWRALCATILEALQPFPEARRAVMDAVGLLVGEDAAEEAIESAARAPAEPPGGDDW